MKNLVIAFIFFTSCGTPKELTEPEIIQPEIVETPLMKTVKAKLIYKPFVNKAGKLIEGAGDYFLVYENAEWFIKFSAGEVLRTEVEKLLDQTATFKLTEHEGLWDTDDPSVQSRIGKYVVLHEIVQ